MLLGSSHRLGRTATSGVSNQEVRDKAVRHAPPLRATTAVSPAAFERCDPIPLPDLGGKDHGDVGTILKERAVGEEGRTVETSAARGVVDIREGPDSSAGC